MRDFITAAICSLLLVSGALADQNDPELDGLFTRLQATEDSDEARVIAQRIWFIWYEHENAEIEFLMEQGEVSMRRSELEDAASIYSRVISIDPDFAEGWNRRATIHYLMGEYDLSTSDVARTLSLEPRHFGALSGQGLIHMRQENPKQALEYFERALEVNPHMPNIRENVELLKQELNADII